MSIRSCRTEIPHRRTAPIYRTPDLRPKRTVPTRGLSTTLIRDEPIAAQTSTQDLSNLLASLIPLDHALLLALHQYRYLDREHVEILLHSKDRRAAQRQIRKLHGLGVIQCWRRYTPPGRRNELPVVTLLSPRGADVLASHLKSPATGYRRRAHDAFQNAWHVDHDLGANGFFVQIAGAALSLCDEGLYHWLGEPSCRALYRQANARVAPDGWGRYVVCDREVMFMLEWDRGTESVARLGAKFNPYGRYFSDVADARQHNLLIVSPSDARAQVVLETAEEVFASFGRRCSAWAIDAAGLAVDPVSAAWHGSDGAATIREMPSVPGLGRPIEDCIAKPGWWTRRRGGGEST
jgi:hypothetical protein